MSPRSVYLFEEAQLFHQLAYFLLLTFKESHELCTWLVDFSPAIAVTHFFPCIRGVHFFQYSRILVRLFIRQPGAPKKPRQLVNSAL